MKYILLILAVACAAYVVYEWVRIGRLVRISSNLVSEARAFENAKGSRSMLVLGDSTAVGVGAPASSTVAARLGAALDARVENHAESGARTRDIAKQFDARKQERYDLVLIQVGANDIIRFTALDGVRTNVDAMLQSARSVSDRVVLLTAGKVGDAPFFPRPLGWLWTNRAADVREHFMAAAKQSGALYVDLYAAADPFSSDPARYYAPDGLHLTADGYGFWYEETKKAVESRWPGLLR